MDIPFLKAVSCGGYSYSADNVGYVYDPGRQNMEYRLKRWHRFAEAPHFAGSQEGRYLTSPRKDAPPVSEVELLANIFCNLDIRNGFICLVKGAYGPHCSMDLLDAGENIDIEGRRLSGVAPRANSQRVSGRLRINCNIKNIKNSRTLFSSRGTFSRWVSVVY